MQKPTPIDAMMTLSDEELVEVSGSNETATTILISRYSKLIYYKAHMHDSIGIDVEDIIQEGLIALVNAISTYDKNNGAKFSTYANVCITNRILTVLSKLKNNGSLLFDSDQLQDDFTQITPESILLEKEKTQELFISISKLLSEKEWKVFRMFLTGSTYDQMARQLNLPLKVVDNAMQRVRRKLKTVWRADNFN